MNALADGSFSTQAAACNSATSVKTPKLKINYSLLVLGESGDPRRIDRNICFSHHRKTVQDILPL